MKLLFRDIIRFAVVLFCALQLAMPAVVGSETGFNVNASLDGQRTSSPDHIAERPGGLPLDRPVRAKYPWLMFLPGLVSSYALPSRYDLREQNLITPVKNQNGLRPDGISDLGTSVGLCWAFASLSSFESSLLKQRIVASPADEKANLSPWHLGNYIGYNTPVYRIDNTWMPLVLPPTTMGYVSRYGGWGGGGGHWTADYIIRGDGPLLWKDAPMPNAQMTRRETLRKPGKGVPAPYLVKEMLLFDPEDFTDSKGRPDEMAFRQYIKSSILRHGALQSFIHLEAIDCPGIELQTCNDVVHHNHWFMDKDRHNLFTYTTENLCAVEYTHAVTIAGWDDNRVIDVDGHMTRGAWLIKDSIGENSHAKGYFWVAYDDQVHLKEVEGIDVVATALVALLGQGYKHPATYQTFAGALTTLSFLDEIDEEDILLLGGQGYLLDGYKTAGKDSWGFARFSLDGDEHLKGVGIVTSNRNETVTVHIYTNWESVVEKSDNPPYAQIFSVRDKGYHLLQLARPFSLAGGSELIIGVGFAYGEHQSKQPLVYKQEFIDMPLPRTYRRAYDRQAGWGPLESYADIYPAGRAGFFLQAVMAAPN